MVMRTVRGPPYPVAVPSYSPSLRLSVETSEPYSPSLRLSVETSEPIA